MIGNCEKDWVLEAKEGCYIVEELVGYIFEKIEIGIMECINFTKQFNAL